MPTVFTVNFRREAYQRELARSRSRVISLGVWLSYFGALVVIFGLYGLNCATVTRRTHVIERQAAAIQLSRGQAIDWSRQPAELVLLERGIGDARRWQERLERLAIALPPSARLTSIEFNPNDVAGGTEWNRLVLTGVFRAAPDEDRMRGVAQLVSTLQRDSVLSSHFASIRLTSTGISETTGNTAHFVIECRP